MNKEGHAEVSYLQSELIPGTDGRTIPHIKCYGCGRKGHYSDKCPNAGSARGGEQHLHTNQTNEMSNEQAKVNESNE